MSASVRDETAPGGLTATVTNFGVARPAKLVFNTDMNGFLKPGSTVHLVTGTGYWYTVNRGSYDTWYMNQGQIVNLGASAARITTPGTQRTRGTAGYSGLVANAVYYQYCSYQDHNGNPDWYCYIDTAIPENGVNPWTKDQWTGKSWATSPQQTTSQVGVLVPNLGERVAALDNEPAVIY
jgi:hypothetical protein